MINPTGFWCGIMTAIMLSLNTSSKLSAQVTHISVSTAIKCQHVWQDRRLNISNDIYHKVTHFIVVFDKKYWVKYAHCLHLVCLAAWDLLFLELLIQKMQALRSFETPVTIYQSTRHKIQKDLNLHKNHLENLTSRNFREDKGFLWNVSLGNFIKRNGSG